MATPVIDVDKTAEHPRAPIVTNTKAANKPITISSNFLFLKSPAAKLKAKVETPKPHATNPNVGMEIDPIPPKTAIIEIATTEVYDKTLQPTEKQELITTNT